jgi:hypothetical protein
MTYAPFRLDGGVPSPEIVAAWTQLWLLPTERVPLWAARWLVAGYDGEHLAYLPGCMATTRTKCVMRCRMHCSTAG